jgi:hypothetical protein
MRERQHPIAPPSSTPPFTGPLGFLLAEYEALRAEILKRTEIQHQLISLALIATGTFLATGSATARLAYPILAVFLAAAWAQSDIRIEQLGAYIEKRVEERLLGDNLGWEHFCKPLHDTPKLRSLAHFASRGVFCGTQILTVLVSFLTTSFPTEDIVLLVVDSLAVILTVILLRQRKLSLERVL